ncbi:MAG: hypothetical protein JMN24_01670, partial [gamma proteobacterium endosymbiont of Lamellibrachia anaximandri]|nr:hypothetical protein [gamma proteobacterium endosymbiont of Lamellibrachia anaximandri]
MHLIPQQTNGFRLKPRTEWMVLIFLFVILLYSNVSQADRFDLGLIALQRGDFAEAFCIWNPLAVEGHKDAAYNLGWLYANGNGLRVDQVSLRPRERFWDIPVPKIDSAFDSLFVPRPSRSLALRDNL